MNSFVDDLVKPVWIDSSTGRMMVRPSTWFRGSADKSGRCAVLWLVQVECGSIVRVNLW
ncbi:hypothetical protein ACH9EU_17415 [Kocuria sp. M1R5S2]|uniref:hypothetical protein n=1 Tax=Kocuria rhizosphaerae TaxID=3376285 RepID=UPI0037B7656C